MVRNWKDSIQNMTISVERRFIIKLLINKGGESDQNVAALADTC